MEIRRAILLFAVVLGLAALVTSFTRPADEEGDRGAPDAETEDRRESSGDGPRTQPRPLPATARSAGCACASSTAPWTGPDGHRASRRRADAKARGRAADETAVDLRRRLERLRREERGITLIELLITAVILNVVLFAILGLLDMSARAVPKDLARAAAIQESQAGLYRMTRELRQAHQIVGASTHTLTVNVFVGGAARA